MKNSGVEVCLMVQNAVLPECEPGHNHRFRVVEEPQGHRSGWHVDECIYCGVKQSYDTSD